MTTHRDTINPGAPEPRAARRKPAPLPEAKCDNCLFRTDCNFECDDWCADHRYRDVHHRRRADYEATRWIE